jgi:hypothetical protein
MPQLEPGPYITLRPQAEVRREKDEVGKFFKEVLRTPESARAFLLKHGLITKGNKVGKRYR